MRHASHLICAVLVALLLTCLASPSEAQRPPAAAPLADVTIQMLPPINGPTNFDATSSTDAYIGRIESADRARGNAYFEGRYWMELVRVLYALAVAGALLWLHISTAMRDLAERLSRNRHLQTAFYVVQYIVVLTVLTFPLSLYEDYARERIFELSNQSFFQWLGNFGISTAVNLTFATILITVLYWVIRKTGKAWWLWGAGISALFLIVSLALAPRFLLPLFIHSTPLPDGMLKTNIEQMATANGVDSVDIGVADISSRSRRIGATLIGFDDSAQIVVSDNLIKEGTAAEIETAISREIGHFVMNHAVTGSTMFIILMFAGFAFSHFSFLKLTSRFGNIWGVRRLEDPAGLPIFIAAGTVFFLLASPVTNWISRSQNQQADIFALNATRHPDAFATWVLKQNAYTKLEPGALEEALFFTVPSPRKRIAAAMRWKQAHLSDPDIANGPISPQNEPILPQ